MIIRLEPPVDTTARRHVAISHGNECIIDPGDYALVSQYHWRCVRSAHNCYAVARIQTNGQMRYVRMHRLIMNCPKGMVVHHKNHNTLDNRRCNLEIMTIDDHHRFT